MPNALGGIAKRADGTINTCRFVRLNIPPNGAGSTHGVVQCTAASDPVLGISQDGSRLAPGLGLIFGGSSADTVAANANESLTVYNNGDECNLQLGGTVQAGQYLAPDASGRGVAVASGGYAYGAQALENGAVNDLIRVRVQIGVTRSA